ncbi:hypothetical protein STREPTOSP366_24530 [Streptomyces variabilis]
MSPFSCAPRHKRGSRKAFAYVTSVATAAGIRTWMVILVSHIRYRRAVDAGRLRASSFPAPGGALFSWVALAFLLGVTVMIAADADARVCLYVAAGWAVARTVLKKGNPAIADRDEDRFEKVG